MARQRMRGDCRVALISIAFTVLAGLPALIRRECKEARPGVAAETRSWLPSNANAGVCGIDAVVAQEPRPDLKPCAFEHRLKQPRERRVFCPDVFGELM